MYVHINTLHLCKPADSDVIGTLFSNWLIFYFSSTYRNKNVSI